MRKYIKHSIKDTVLIKKILAIDLFEWESDYVSKEENHDFWEFIYVEKGEVCYEIENKTPVTLKKDDIFFLSPKQNHVIRASKKNQSSKTFFVCFECKSLIINVLAEFSKHADETDKKFLSFLIDEALNTFKTSSFEKLTPLEHPRLGGEQCVQLYLELLIINLLREQSENSNPTIFFKSDDNIRVICERIYSMLKKNIYSSLTIDDICKTFNYSRSYISHSFKTYYNKSIITCFNELKIEEAKKLLMRNDISIAKISDKLNFSDFHLFNYTFRKYTGMSPSEYRSSFFSQLNEE